MSGKSRGQRRDSVAPQAGGTSTPIAGSKDGTGEKDPVMSEEADKGADEEELTGSRTDRPGYGQPA